MAVSLEQFNLWKHQIESHLSSVKRQLNELDYQTEVDRIADIGESMQHDRFQVIVVGEFARGKSMFINALMGRPILPSLPRPSTAIRNTIVYSEEPYIRLHYHDENKESFLISEEAFGKLIAPIEPIMGDARSQSDYETEIAKLNEIQFAEVGYPLEICKEGVTLLDTPGLGDLDANRSAITNELIPGSDVAIFLLSATKALSKSEMSLLTDRLFKNDIQKVFVVINFKDALMNEGDAQKVYDKVTNDLQSLLPKSNIYLISAKEQLNLRRSQNGEKVLKRGRPVELWTEEETGFAALEADISHFLQFERGAVKLLGPVKKAQRVMDDILTQTLPIERNTMSRSREAFEQQVKGFHKKLKDVRVTGNKAQQKLKETMKLHEGTVQTWYEGEVDKIVQAGLAAYDSAYGVDLSELPQVVDAAIAPLERDLESNAQDRKKVIMKIALDRAGKLLNDEWTKFEEGFTFEFGTRELSALVESRKEDEIERKSTTNRMVIFEDILEELTWNWREKSTINKVASGIGVALTSASYAVAALGHKIMDWLTGEPNERDKLRSEIHAQLRNMKNEKYAAFKYEWKISVQAFTNQYGVLIDRQITSKEEQLQKMLKNISLQGNEVERKLEQLNVAEHNLRNSTYELGIIGKQLKEPEEAILR